MPVCCRSQNLCSTSVEDEPQFAEAAWKLRPDLKVLFVTGYADGASVGNSLLDDRMQVMTKPFKLDTFVTKIGETIMP